MAVDMTQFNGSAHLDPDTEVPVRAARRAFSASYKMRVLAEYDTLGREGRGALLRREGLQTSLISEWRKQRDKGGLETLAKAPGRPPADSVEREVARLRRDNERMDCVLEPTKDQVITRHADLISGTCGGGR